MGCGWEFFFSMILKRGEQAESTSLWARTMSPSQTWNTDYQSSVYLKLQVNVYVCAHEWLPQFLMQRIKYWAYLKYLQMLVLDSEWSGERDVWLFVCKTLVIYNKSGAYLGAIKSDFINNAKLGEGSLYRLCMNVWEMNHLLFSRTEFLFNHAINLFLCCYICLKMAQRKCRIGFCLITFEIAARTTFEFN